MRTELDLLWDYHQETTCEKSSSLLCLSLTAFLSADDVIFLHAHTPFFCDCKFCLKTYCLLCLCCFPFFFFFSALDSILHTCQKSHLKWMCLCERICEKYDLLSVCAYFFFSKKYINLRMCKNLILRSHWGYSQLYSWLWFILQSLSAQSLFKLKTVKTV